MVNINPRGEADGDEHATAEEAIQHLRNFATNLGLQVREDRLMNLSNWALEGFVVELAWRARLYIWRSASMPDDLNITVIDGERHKEISARQAMAIMAHGR